MAAQQQFKASRVGFTYSESLMKFKNVYIVHGESRLFQNCRSRIRRPEIFNHFVKLNCSSRAIVDNGFSVTPAVAGPWDPEKRKHSLWDKPSVWSPVPVPFLRSSEDRLKHHQSVKWNLVPGMGDNLAEVIKRTKIIMSYRATLISWQNKSKTVEAVIQSHCLHIQD